MLYKAKGSDLVEMRYEFNVVLLENKLYDSIKTIENFTTKYRSIKLFF